MPLNARVRPIASQNLPVRSASAHFGASDAREFYSWNPSSGSADSDLLPDIGTLRPRSRDLFRNHGIASGALQTQIDNILGIGPRLSTQPDYRTLGQDKAWADEWARVCEGNFREWWETTACDVSRQLTGRAMSTQVLRGALMNGDALALCMWTPGRGSRFATCLQVVETDRLSTPNGKMDGPNMRGGIETDEFGKPIAYHIQKAHPGEFFTPGYSADQWQWERIPAETPWGRARVIHVHDKERTGQSRGKPMLAAVIGQFRMLEHYQRTTLQSAVISAMISAFIETPLSPDAVLEALGGSMTDTKAQQYMAAQREMMSPLKGAAVLSLPPGSQMKPFMPGQPTDQFAPFVEAVIRHIGVGLNLPYELLLKDFSKTNYSSARAALLEAWRFFAGRRAWLMDTWFTPVYRLWLEEAVNGFSAVTAPGFYANRFAYERAKWIWPGRGWIDPVKEAEASKIRMDANLSTLQQECAEQGLDWEEVLEQRAAERARMKELGLPDPVPVPSSPGRPADQQQPQEEPIPA